MSAHPAGHTSERRDVADPDLLGLDEVDHLPTWTLVRAARRVERMLVELFAAHGLTPVQFGVLVYLGTGTEFTQSQLARKVLIRPQSMNTVIAEMIDRGLLERVGSGGRGRPTPIRPTPAGIDLLRTIQPTVRWANEPERLGLDTRRATKLNEILHDILDSDLPLEFEVEFRSREPRSAQTSSTTRG